MPYRFVIADVFTEKAFGGNQLAVFPEADGLTDRAMQALAREFNFPESTFVFPSKDPRHAARVRIFTPKTELLFAGHPTVGTAAVLAHLGLVKTSGATTTITLEEGIGPVPVEVRTGKAGIFCRFSLTQEVERPSAAPDPKAAAETLSLGEDAVLEAWFAGIGPRFCFVRLANREIVDRAALDRARWSKAFARAWGPSLYMFAGELRPGGLYVRMFAPIMGIEEDAATGSGAATLTRCLAERLPEQDGSFAWRIDQGVAMGRPSVIETSAEKRRGRVAIVTVGGYTVPVGEGTLIAGLDG